MSPMVSKDDLKAFSVRDLPRDLIDDADRHMKALHITDWHKKFVAGMLQMIRLGLLPPEFLRLVCTEGAVSKQGGTMYMDRAAFLEALRASVAPLQKKDGFATVDEE